MSKRTDQLVKKRALREAVGKLLERFNILPYEDWEHFAIVHEKPSLVEKKRTYAKIREKVGGKGGVYVYEKDGQTLYVGRGSSLERRIKRHYHESYMESRRFAKAQRAFFSRNQGKLNVYYRDYNHIEDEDARRGIEQMLIFALEPHFESFRQDRKRVRSIDQS